MSTPSNIRKLPITDVVLYILIALRDAQEQRKEHGIKVVSVITLVLVIVKTLYV